MEPLHIIGGGMAGSEAAWQAAQVGVPVVLHEMRPQVATFAHRTGDFAEMVCSNSFRSDDDERNAVWLLHWEMRAAGGLIMEMGTQHRLPAGGALAVDRDPFAAAVTERLKSHPLISTSYEEVTELPSSGHWIIATGPLTSPSLAESIRAATAAEALAFFDTIAPFVYTESIDMSIAWLQSRYDKGETEDEQKAYINCPMTKPQYEAFIDALTLGRQKQVVSLIRTQFLKRFESSVHSFRASCWSLLIKLFAWVEVHTESAHEKRLLERWKNQHATLINYAQTHQLELFGQPDDRDADEDVIPEEMLEAVEKLPRDKFKVDEIIDETLLDLDQIASFLKELDKYKAWQDKKLQALLVLLKKDAVLSKHKVLIFSEFMTTARYLKQQLQEAGIEGVEEIDSASKADRGEVITRFSPYYNGSSSAELAAAGKSEIRVLIATDVLSEGLNQSSPGCIS